MRVCLLLLTLAHRERRRQQHRRREWRPCGEGRASWRRARGARKQRGQSWAPAGEGNRGRGAMRCDCGVSPRPGGTPSKEASCSPPGRAMTRISPACTNDEAMRLKCVRRRCGRLCHRALGTRRVLAAGVGGCLWPRKKSKKSGGEAGSIN